MKTLLTVAALVCGLSAPAYADNVTGRWMDIHNHLDLGDLPDSDVHIARLNYSKTVCHARLSDKASLACMKADGFVFIPDSPAQIAAQNAADQNARMRASGYALGQALINAGNSMNQQHHCNGYVGGGGSFNMNCN